MKWFEVKMQANNVGEIYIYGDIEDFKWYEEDVTPKDIVDQLKKVDDAKEINVYVNSGGGSVFAGVAIYNSIKRINKPVTAYIDGLAASIASLIVLAADKVVMPSNALFMIHNPWAGTMGEAEVFRKMADTLDKIKGIILDSYKQKTGMDEAELSKMMDEETWLNGNDAFEMGFADEVEEEQKIAASFSGENIRFKDIEVKLDNFKNFKKDKFEEFQPKTQMSIQQRHRHEMFMLSAQL